MIWFQSFNFGFAAQTPKENAMTREFIPDLFSANYETCKNGNPTCEQWADRGHCDNLYLIRHCKPACDLCPMEEVRLTCEGVRDAMAEHLEDNLVFGKTFIHEISCFPLVCTLLLKQT